MVFENLVTQLGIYLATFVFCFIGGIFPFANTEVYLVTVSAISARETIIPILIISIISQMAAKVIVYFAGNGAIKLPLRKYEKKIARVKEKFENSKVKPGYFVLISAMTGIPPFYIVTLLSGMMKVHIWDFILFGLLGTSIKFTASLYLPQVIKILFA